MQKFNTIEIKGLRVLTTKQIAEAYATTVDVLKHNFNYNKQRFIPGKHYIPLEGAELRELKTRDEFLTSFKYAKILYLWTEKGALLHAKSLNTDQAWEAYEYLVDFYFRVREEQESEQANVETNKPEFAGVRPAKGIVVDIPENKEAQKLIAEMRKYIFGMDALLDVYNMFLNEEEFQKVGYAVQAMGYKISRIGLFLSTFKPTLVEKYL